MKTIKELQEFLGVTTDGVWGPKSQDALDSVIHPKASVVLDGKIDSRSEQNILTLNEKVQPYARQLVLQCAREGIKIVVTSGTRTYEEQDQLYNQGGVTHARGGYSNHNFGLAFDVTIFVDTRPIWDSPQYKLVGAIGKSLGLSWGGDWVSIQDEPHFELRPEWAKDMTESQMITELRNRTFKRESLI